MEQVMTTAFITGLLAAMMRMATPIIFGTLGEILCERAGVLNLGIEGIMLMGAMTGTDAAMRPCWRASRLMCRRFRRASRALTRACVER